MPDEPRHDALRAKLADLAAEDAHGLVAEALAGARARVRAILEEALVDELLQAAQTASRPSEPRPPREPRPADEPGPADETRPTRSNGDAYWAYCVLAANELDALPDGLAGVEPRTQVEVVQEGDLAALVSRVPLADYEDEPLREHLNDIDWVDRTARAHEAVLERAQTSATIIPLRLCTLYRQRDGVRGLLSDSAQELRRNLDDVRGRAEWGVKLFVDQERLAASHSAMGEDEGGQSETSVGTGAGYLARKQRQRSQAQRSDTMAAECSEDVHRRLAQLSVGARVNPLQRPEAHGHSAEMLLNGVYLVDESAAEEFKALVTDFEPALEEAGFEHELTGPWPPYNFVSFSAPGDS